MATKPTKKKQSSTTAKAAPVVAAPAIITKKEPEGWVNQLLAKMGSEDRDKLEAQDPALRRFIDNIEKRRQGGDNDLTAAELNKIHTAGVITGHRRHTH